MYIARYVCNFTIYFFLVGKLLLVCSVTLFAVPSACLLPLEFLLSRVE